jgi:uncharacterized protein (DUF2252 family)
VLEKTETKEHEVLQYNALEALRKEIRSSTASMTSVPKPLKFMRPHYGALEKHYDTMKDGDNKVSCTPRWWMDGYMHEGVLGCYHNTDHFMFMLYYDWLFLVILSRYLISIGNDNGS